MIPIVEERVGELEQLASVTAFCGLTCSARLSPATTIAKATWTS